MSSQRYERVRDNPIQAPPHLPRNPTINSSTMLTTIQVSNTEEDTPISAIPSSPPPSFRSIASSPTSRHFLHDPEAAVDQNLADTFDADGSDDEENDGDDRQRLMRGMPSSPATEQTATPATTVTGQTTPPRIERRATYLPVFVPQPAGQTARVFGGGSGSDGVFSNLSAKPEAGEKMEEHPPVRIPHPDNRIYTDGI